MTDVRSTPLGAGAEFDLVRELVARLGDVARGVGDDAATVDLPPGERMVVSTDVFVEGTHFLPGWLTPDEVGYRATAAALSDLAAMAATPRAVVVAITTPDAWRASLPAIADGIARAARANGVHVVGGDLARGKELGVAVTVIGSAAAPVSRGGARVGDAVWVTGTLGGPGAAVVAWYAGRVPGAPHRARVANPAPRIAAAQWLASHGATAMIDISDGLVADLGHVAAASGVRVVLDVDRVPHLAGIDALVAARGGEEYELAVAAPPTLDAQAFTARFNLPLTRVGEVVAGPAGVVAAPGGSPLPDSRGFDHFAR